MRLCRHATVADLLQVAGPFLDAAEVEHNLLVGVIHLLQHHPERYAASPLLGTLHQEGALAGVVIRTRPFGLLCTDLPPGAEAVLVAELREEMTDLGEVLGPVETAERVARTWGAATGRAVTPDMPMEVYALTRVVPPPRPPGGLRPADSEDRALLEDWIRAFHEDVGLPEREAPAAVAERWVAEGAVHLWADGAPACMVATDQATPRGARIVAVYTPAERRRRGYAAAAVAEVCARELAGGRTWCFLFADADNPTSNGVYRRVGFRPVTRFRRVVLEPAPSLPESQP